MGTNVSFNVGFKVRLTKTVSEQDVQDFAKISGDSQPLHVDATYAKATRFQQRIAHGVLVLGLISGALGTKLVGRDQTIILLGQSVRYLKPTYFGDTVTAECEVTKIRPDKPIVTLACKCTNQKGEVLLEGDATVMIDPTPFVATAS